MERGAAGLATTADRVLGVLALFAGDRWKWTVEEAAEELGLPVSTAYRYFKSLSQVELLSSHLTGHYMLGPAVCVLDRAMRLHDPFISAAATEMRRLADEYPETIILLTRLYRDTVMCVHREGEMLVAHGYERGRPMPLHRGAASKVILAHLTARQLRNLSATGEPPAVREIEASKDELRHIRAQGYAITRGEIDPGRIGLSVPVFRGRQALEGSLSFVLDARRAYTEDSMIEALVKSRKVVEANLLLADLPDTASRASATE